MFNKDKNNFWLSLSLSKIFSMRLLFIIFGIGSFIFGASSYFVGVLWPINCKTIVCHIGTAIPLDLAMMLVGIGLMFLSLFFNKKKKR